MSSKAKSLLNKKIKNFTAPMTEGEFSLKEFEGKHLVLYFYPKDSTPGCTIEGQDFSKLLSQFKKQGAEVFGISRDSVESHCKFRDKQKYKMDLISDADEKICKLFDVIQEKNMYGKKVLGIERSTFILDPEAVVVAEWRKVKVEGHAEEVLEKLKSLGSQK